MVHRFRALDVKLVKIQPVKSRKLKFITKVTTEMCVRVFVGQVYDTSGGNV